MILKNLFTGWVFFACALLAHGELKVLTLADGRVAELMIDFKLDDVHIDADGNVIFVARATENGEAVGFSAQISSPRRAEMDQMGKDETLQVAKTGITVKSIGKPTVTLEALLNRRFRRDANDDQRRQVVGEYAATSSLFTASVATIALFDATDVGITRDEIDKSKPAECFSMRLLIDGPMERLTAYFSLRAGYGGTSAHYVARQLWTTSKQNTLAEPATNPKVQK